MTVHQEDYLSQVVELRDAGRQLLRLFDEDVRKAGKESERQKMKRQYLETELYILQLEEIIEKFPTSSLSPA